VTDMLQQVSNPMT